MYTTVDIDVKSTGTVVEGPPVHTCGENGSLNSAAVHNIRVQTDRRCSANLVDSLDLIVYVGFLAVDDNRTAPPGSGTVYEHAYSSRRTHQDQ